MRMTVTQSRRLLAILLGLLTAMGLALTWTAGTANAVSENGLYQLSAGRPSQPVGQKGEVFYQKDFYVTWHGGDVTIASGVDGKGDFWVDDILDMTINRSDGTSVSRTFDDSNSCTATRVIFTAPYNLKADLRDGLNLIRVTFRDSCGGNDGNSAIYLAGTATFETISPLPGLPALDAGTFVVANYLSGSPAGSQQCTTGFNVMDPLTGNLYSTLAKHCIDAENGDQANNSSIGAHQPMDINTSDQRYAFATSLDCSPSSGKCLLPPPRSRVSGDYVAWPTDTATPSFRVATKNGVLLPVLGAKDWQDVANQQICHYGQGSAGKGNAERCGPALTRGEKIYACAFLIDCSGGLVPEPMFGTGGDSGGPVYVYNAARTGVYAVGLEIKAAPTGSLIVPIQTVLNRLGNGYPLALITAQ